jgi:hypothetical protein
MRNPFSRFVWLVIFVLALLAFGLARMTKAALLDGAAVSDGVTEAAHVSETASAVSPSPATLSGASTSVTLDSTVGKAAERGSVNVIANPAPLEALLAAALPLLIATFKSKIPEDKRKWIPVFAPILGELISHFFTTLPNGSGLVAGLAAVGVREIKDQHSNSGEGTGASGASKGGSPNGIVTGLGMAFVFAAGLLLFCGSLAGCARLDPKGIYHGDKVAYDVDATIDGAYSALDSFVQWHRANAVIVDAKWPEIAAFARQLEGGEGDQWVDDTLDLRDAYTKNPSAENRTALDRAVAVLTTALAKAAVYQARLAGGK